MTPEMMANFEQALQIMGQGMGGIMAVILIITLLVYLISKISDATQKKKDENGGNS